MLKKLGEQVLEGKTGIPDLYAHRDVIFKEATACCVYGKTFLTPEKTLLSLDQFISKLHLKGQAYPEGLRAESPGSDRTLAGFC